MAARKVQRAYTPDELAVMEEARGYCVRYDKQPSHYNITTMIRKYFPGRGRKLSNVDIKLFVTSQEGDSQ